MEYKDSISTIEVDHDFPRNLTEDVLMPGSINEKIRMFPLAEDVRTAREQLRTIEIIMKIPSYPNIPRLAARVIDVHSPRYIVLKEVGEPFLVVKDAFSSTDLIICAEQIKWAILYLHDHNVSHGNISVENIRVKSTTPACAQLIGLQNANLSPSDEDKQKYLEELDNMLKEMDIPFNNDILRHSIDVVHKGIKTTYDYETLHVVSLLEHIRNTYISRGTFATISIQALTPIEINELVMISSHEHLITIYRKETVRSPQKNVLLLDYYPEAETLDNFIHGSKPYNMKDAIAWIVHLSQVLKFIGNQQLVHGSILPENILKTGRGVKIIALENISKKTRDTRYPAEKWNPRKDWVRLCVDFVRNSYGIPAECMVYEYFFHKNRNRYGSFKRSELPQIAVFDTLMRLVSSFADKNTFPLKYDLTFVARHLDILIKDDIAIPPITNFSPFISNQKVLPLSEFATAESEHRIVHFHRHTSQHIKLEASAPMFSKSYPNKAIVLKCDLECWCSDFARRRRDELYINDYVWMNRPLEFGEAIKVTMCRNMRDGKEQISMVFVKKHGDRERIDGVDPYSNAGRYRTLLYTYTTNKQEETAILYRLTSRLVVARFFSADNRFPFPMLFKADMGDILFISMQRGKLKYLTIKHVDELEVKEVSEMENLPSIPDIRPFRVSTNLDDIFIANETDCVVLGYHKVFQSKFDWASRMDVSGIIGPRLPKEIFFHSIEYKSLRYALLHDEYTIEYINFFGSIYDGFIPCPLLLVGPHQSPLLVNIRGFTRNDNGITAVILEDVAGTLRDEVIMNPKWIFNLPQVYRWIGQIAEALQLLSFTLRQQEYSFSSKFVFLTAEQNAKLFVRDLARSIDAPRVRTRYNSPEYVDSIDTAESLVYTLGTVIWDLLHRKEHQPVISSINELSLNFPIDEYAGDSILRALIERCWSIDPQCRPHLEEIITIANGRLTELELTFTANEFTILASMAVGQFSNIDVVQLPSVGEVVLKHFKNMSDIFKKREVEALRLSIGNPFFPLCHAIVGTFENIEGVLLEKLRGNMWNEIIQNKQLKYGPYEISSWAWQVSSAVLFLHSKEIIHRDIKPDNALVDHDFASVKLSDFGITTHSDRTTDFQGTYRYCAPEAKGIERGRYNFAMDVYSLGVTIYELIERKDFINRDMQDVTLTPSVDSAQMSFFIERCCSHNPHMRPNTKDIVSYLKKKMEQFNDVRSLLISENVEPVPKKVKFAKQE